MTANLAISAHQQPSSSNDHLKTCAKYYGAKAITKRDKNNNNYWGKPRLIRANFFK
jgi:hypothetical protein